jgi:predicted ATPase
MVENGEVKEDSHQIAALKELDRLYKELEQSEPITTCTAKEQEESPPFSFTAIFGGWFSRAKKRVSTFSHHHKGVYLHGGVGCGKTFCMNLFYDHVNGKWAQDKQHVHFHKFMLGVHQQVSYTYTRTRLYRARGTSGVIVIVPYVIRLTLVTLYIL